MSEIVKAVVSLLGLPASTVAFVEAAERVHNSYSSWKRDRLRERLVKFQEYLRSRIEHVEDRVAELENEKEKLDLFEMTLEGLVEDDDDKKVCFYAAFLDFVLSGQHDSTRLRMAGEAIKALTSQELEMLPDYLASGPHRARVPEWMRDLFPLRLQSHGLFTASATVKSPALFSVIGDLVREIARLGVELRMRPDATQDVG